MLPSLIRGVGLLALIGFLLWSGTYLSGTLMILWVFPSAVPMLFMG
ncbi:hypothetical protein HYW60_01310 [Candidatus Kaiserbacteria bacterium]|nr:hypothetical protein [Candidatus Kaiserbacteria bacterium]